MTPILNDPGVGASSLGGRVRYLRTAKAMSQGELASPEVSDSYVSLIESGRRSPTLPVIKMLARKLECSPSYLLSGIEVGTAVHVSEVVRCAQTALSDGRVDAARDRFAAVLADPALIALPTLAHEARLGHAMAANLSGEPEQAVAELRDLATEIVRAGRPDRIAEVHTALVRCLAGHGDLDASIQAGETALRRLATKTAHWTPAKVILCAAVLDAYTERGDLVYADLLGRDLLSRAETVADAQAVVRVCESAAHIAELRGDLNRALLLAEKAMAAGGSDRRESIRMCISFVRILLLARPGEAERGRMILDLAAQDARTVTGPVGLQLLLVQARAHILLDHPLVAARLAEQAATLRPLPVTGMGAFIAEALIVFGHAHLLLDRHTEAIKALSEAASRLSLVPCSPSMARLWTELAELLKAAGRSQDAVCAFQRAMKCVGLESSEAIRSPL